MRLLGATKLRSLPSDKQDEGAPTFSRVLSRKSISERSRLTFSARSYVSINIFAQCTFAQLKYAHTVSQRAPRKRFELERLPRTIRTNFTRSRHTRFQLGAAKAVNAKRRSAVVVRVPQPVELVERFEESLTSDFPLSGAATLHLMCDGGLEGVPEVCASRSAIPERDQRSLLVVLVVRIWSSIGPSIAFVAAGVGGVRYIASLPEQSSRPIGCRNLERVRSRILREISADMASAFNTLADELSTLPHTRRVLEVDRECPRNTANPHPAMGSTGGRRCDRSGSDHIWQFGNSLRQRQQYFLPWRISLCIAGAIASIDIIVATVRGS